MKNLLFLLLFCMVGTVNATTYTWTGSSSINWNDASNWSPATVPGSADIASFTNTSTTYQPKLDTSRSIAGLTVSANISLDLNTYQLTVNGNTTLDRGTYSNGSLIVNGTTLSLGYMNAQGTVYYGPTLSCSLTVTAATLSIKFSTFNAAVVLTKTGSSTDQWQGGNTFNSTVSMTNSGSGLLNPGFRGVNTYNAAVSLYNQSSGSIGFSQTANIGSNVPYCYINADLYLSNTGSGEINLGRYAATYYSTAKTIRMAAGTRIRIAAPGFSSGTLHLENLRQEAADSLAFSLSGTALLRTTGCQIKGLTEISVPNLQTSMNSYDLALTFTISNGNNSNSWGGNQFSGPVTLNHSGASGFSWAIGGSDYFSSTLTLNLTGAGAFGIATGILNGNPTTFSDHVYVNNTGGGSGFIIGTYRTNPSNPQLAVFAADKRVIIGSGGFSSGILKMERTTFSGSSPWSLSLGGSGSTLYLGDNLITNQVFSGTAPNVIISGSTFNDSLKITKTGNSTNQGYGGTTYNGAVVFNINGTGHFAVGVYTKDLFNSDLAVNTTSSGGFYSGNMVASEILGSISFFRSGTGFLQLGSSFGGGILFTGSTDQSIYVSGSGAGEAQLYKATINKPSGKLKLYGDVNAYSAMTLTSGIIQNNGGMLHFRAGSSVSGASDASYIEGVAKKTGNTAFTFPLGAGGKYNPLAITAPSSASDAFTAEFISGSANTSYSLSSKESSLDQMDEDGYWKLARSSGSSTPTVTLNWHSLKCGVTSPSTLSFAQWNAATSQWLNKGNAANTATSLTHTGTLAFSTTPIPLVLGNIHKMAANAGADTSFCAGASVGLSASGSYGTAPFTYSWSPTTGLSSSTVANPTASPASTTTYTVTVTDARGCSASDEVVVTVNELPVADAGEDTTIYAGDTVQIGGAGVSGNTYSWSPTIGLSDSTISSPILMPEEDKRYFLTVVSIQGCTSQDSVNIYLHSGFNCANPIELNALDSCIININTKSKINDLWLSFYAVDSVMTIRFTKDSINSLFPDSIFIYDSVCNNVLFQLNDFGDNMFLFSNNFISGRLYKILIKKGLSLQEFSAICINSAHYMNGGCGTTTQDSSRANCQVSCDCTHNPRSPVLRYEKSEYYRDGFSTQITSAKDIKLYIHVIQNGSYNPNNPNYFQEGNSFHNSFLLTHNHSVLNWLNRLWSSNIQNNMPPSGVSVTNIPNGANIQFVPVIKYHQVPSNIWSSNNFNTIMAYIRSQDGDCKYRDGINYIFGHQSLGGNISGQANGLASCNISHDDGAYSGGIMGWYTVNTQGGQVWGWPLAWHMSHEIGHVLGLEHTYSGGGDISDITCSDYLSDVFGLPFGGYIPKNPNGSNNIMAASANAQFLYFSPLQIGRIHRNLSIKSTRKVVANCPMANQSIIVDLLNTGPENWDTDMRLFNNVEVQNTQLQITCRVEMEDVARIIVEPRSTLTIDGGVVTSACTVWKGIRVKSGPTLGSTSGFYLGTCKVINGGTVSNAEVGIGVFGNEIWLNTGGKLNIDNARFINNRKAISFGSKPDVTNQSVIQNSEFLCNYPMNSPNYTITDPVTNEQVRLGAKEFITNWNTIGVVIKNNLFKMETTYDYFNPSNCSTVSESFPEKYWTDGIVTYDARMQVLGTDLTTPTCNQFVNLKSGINIDKTVNMPTRYLYIYKNQFENCLQGIYSKSSQNDMVFHNEFKIPSSFAQTLQPRPYGVFMDNYKHCIVGGNYFSDYSADTDPSRWGLVIKYAGSTTDNADIRWNSFENLKYGFQAEGPHYGAKLRCNDFTTIDYEWLIDPNGSATNVFNTQGNCFFGGAQARPGNRFFDSGNHITSNTANQWLYSTTPVSPILPSFASFPIQGSIDPCQNLISYSSICPNYPYSIAPNPPYPPLFEREALAITIDSLSNIKDSLAGILDNGQTDTLLARIGRSSYSNNSLTTDLVANSPLSDTVLVSIIGRSNALNDSLLIASFIPNSPVSQWVAKYLYKGLDEYDSATLDTLANAQISNPGYLTVERIQRLLDYQTTELNTKLSEVVGYYAYYDSLFPNLIGFLEDTLQTIEAQKMVVSQYYGSGQLDSARTKLDDFEASNANDSAFARYMDILLTLAEDSSSVFEMDSTQRSFVESLALGSTDMAKYAEATMELVDDTIIDMWPVVYYPPAPKMESGENEFNSQISNSIAEEIKLYPNPNNGSLTLSYKNDGSNAKLTIVLFDIMGRELFRAEFAQNDAEKQSVEIPNMVTGFVLAQVRRGSRPIHHQRIIIQR